MLNYRTAGESHGPGIVALVEGLPLGLRVDLEFINRALRRRQGGYGRSERQKIEADAAEVLSGVYRGETIASPVTLLIRNRDAGIETKPPVEVPRPGHADLAGMLKYGLKDARAILERSSARETAGRVAAGALAQLLLREVGVSVVGFVSAVGGVEAEQIEVPAAELAARRDRSELYMLDPKAEAAAKIAIDRAKTEGDSLGGIVEVRAFGVPAGLGSHVQWDARLDGRLAGAVMAVQAIKGVEIGLGFAAARRPGSLVHDEILPGAKGLTRGSNNAGGIEGGISNGQTVVLRAAMKPIPTLRKPLRSVNLRTAEATAASYERSDVTAVPAASVVVEAVVAFEIARALLEKFPADTVTELRAACGRSRGQG